MSLNEKLVKILREKGFSITTMESCTGGLLISTITDVEGASVVTDGGYVTYSNKAKIDIGVKGETIEKYGVYSLATAREMAEVSRELKKADIGVGITGSLNNIDVLNKDSIPCKVFYAINYKCNDSSEATDLFEIFVPKMERGLQKKYIVNIILIKLLELLK